MEALAERPIYLLAEKYSTSPKKIRKWSDYDYNRAWMFFVAENGGGGKVTEDEVEERLKARRGDMAEGVILEHLASHWAGRTRESVQTEGYDADYIAGELALLGLTFADESLPKEKKAKGGKLAHAVDTAPLDQPEEHAEG